MPPSVSSPSVPPGSDPPRSVAPLSNSLPSRPSGSARSGSAARPARSSVPPERFTLVDGEPTIDGLRIGFQRTLRVGDQGANALPPSLGRFGLRPVGPDDERIPEVVRAKGGVLLPMYVREAMWISFDADEPIAIQIGTGGLCVLTGRDLRNRLMRRPQNYVVATEQPWLDGFKTATGEVRQFVGVPAGSGLSVEAQLAPGRSTGGIQIQVWRLTPEALERWHRQGHDGLRMSLMVSSVADACSVTSMMEIGAGGRIVQEVVADEFAAVDWQRKPAARVWVHPVSIPAWMAWTGERAPSTPVDAQAYISAGLPWFDWFDDSKEALPATEELSGIASVGELTGLNEPSHVPVDSPLVRRLGDARRLDLGPGDWAWGSST